MPLNIRATDMSLIPAGFLHVSSGTKLNLTQFIAHSAGQTIAAAAGIGAPERFFTSLRAMGVPLTETLHLPDHHALDPVTLLSLNAPIVLITSKDAIKCQSFNDTRLWVALVDAVFSDAQFADWLSQALTHVAASRHRAQ